MKTIKINIPEGMSANINTTRNGLHVSFDENTTITWGNDDTTITWEDEPSIIKKVQSIAPFELTEWQKQMILTIENNDKCIIRKHRQVGMTEIFAMLTAIKMYKNWNVYANFLYLSHNKDASERFVKKVRFYIDKLSHGAIFSTNRKDELSWYSSNLFTVDISKDQYHLGYRTYDWVIVDEAAFTNTNISDIESKTKNITVASTLHGLDNTFLPLWLKSNKRGYKRFTLEKEWYIGSGGMRKILGDKFDYEYDDRLLNHLTLSELEMTLKLGGTIYVGISDKADTRTFTKFMCENGIIHVWDGRNIIIFAQ